MDLGGVDIGPDHREPVEGDAMAGLYEHKRSFGALGRDDRRARTGHPAMALRARASRRARGQVRRPMTGTGTGMSRLGPRAPRPLGPDRAARRGGTACAVRASMADPPAAALADVTVTGVTHDSRAVVPGSLFVAVPGEHADGHDFAPAAARRGRDGPHRRAAAPRSWPSRNSSWTRPAGLRQCRGWWFGDPSHQLTVVGITGTDGKTTTAYLAVAALEAAGRRAGMIGTIATRVGGRTEDHEAHATTPEAPELQATLRAMVDAGDDVAVVETTSHGLALDRVASVAYDVAILTNLTHEHLELHGTWEAYRDAKLSLFDRLQAARAPQAAAGAGGRHRQLDDPSAGRSSATPATRVPASSPTAPSRRRTCGRSAMREDADGLRADIETPGGGATLELRLAGRFNVHNALAVVALGEVLALDPVAVRTGLAQVEGVPGAWSASTWASRSGS